MLETRRPDVLLYSSDALEQVGVAVGASAAVTQHSNAGPPSHGAAVAYPALGIQTHTLMQHLVFFCFYSLSYFLLFKKV